MPFFRSYGGLGGHNSQMVRCYEKRENDITIVTVNLRGKRIQTVLTCRARDAAKRHRSDDLKFLTGKQYYTL